jgi:aquaporin Z
MMRKDQQFIAELIGTFVLVLGGCGTAVFAGRPVGFLGVVLVIGLMIALIHLISIPLTNIPVNQARSVSQVLFADNALALPQLWVFIGAPVLGAALVAYVYSAVGRKKVDK